MSTPDAMARFGTALADGLPDLTANPALLYLAGDLGAGKTTLARGLLAALGVNGPVHSPSFTLVETYALPTLTALHVDLYRLIDPEEIEPLGLRDAYAARHLWILEWPERAAGNLPPADVTLLLRIGADAHQVEAVHASPRGRIWLEAAQQILATPAEL